MLTSMVNHEIILRKVAKLKEHVNQLRQADDITWEKYRRSVRDHAFVERYIHLAIQTVFDIANPHEIFTPWNVCLVESFILYQLGRTPLHRGEISRSEPTEGRISPRSQKATALAVDECGPSQGFR